MIITSYNDVRDWYAKKTNKTTDEFDDYDNHLCKVAYDYASDLVSLPKHKYGISGSDWFMKSLGKFERDKIRSAYRINDPTLKLTDEILDGVLVAEMGKPIHFRELDPRFYPKNITF